MNQQHKFVVVATIPAAYNTAQGTYVVVSTTSGSTGCPAGGTGSGGRRVMAVRIGTNLQATIAWCAVSSLGLWTSACHSMPRPSQAMRR